MQPKKEEMKKDDMKGSCSTNAPKTSGSCSTTDMKKDEKMTGSCSTSGDKGKKGGSCS